MLFSTDPNHPACHFNRAELLALLTCSSKDEARVNLNTVLLDPAVRSAVVTDGHRMLIATETPPAAKGAKVKAAAGPSVVLRRTDVESWAKAAKAHEQIRIEWSDGTVTAIVRALDDAGEPAAVRLTSSTTAAPVVFPPWRAVMPAHAPESACGAVTVNAAYLADACGVLAKVARLKSAPSLSIFPGGSELDPILFSMAGEGADWRYVLMPCRMENHSRVSPWLGAIVQSSPPAVEPQGPAIVGDAVTAAIGDSIRREDIAATTTAPTTRGRGRARKAA